MTRRAGSCGATIPGVRYVVLAPTDAGLLQVLVRVNVPGEGPRASAKVIRWNRVQLGELALEMVSGHRLLGLPGREPRPARLGRRGRCDGRVRPRAVREGRRAAVHAAGAKRRRPARSAKAGAATSGAARAGAAQAGARRKPARARPVRGQAERRHARRRASRPPRAANPLPDDRAPEPWQPTPSPTAKRPLHPFRRTIRYWLSRLVAGAGHPRLDADRVPRASSACPRAPPSTASTTCRGPIRSC